MPTTINSLDELLMYQPAMSSSNLILTWPCALLLFAAKLLESSNFFDDTILEYANLLHRMQ